ncbi:hypothetical protein FOA52_013060 [Chlamydomonas sp. UWO 241]|nr:hypothetical protein FOA52_013060 [Chlamydomonas sp. UWO 241]
MCVREVLQLFGSPLRGAHGTGAVAEASGSPATAARAAPGGRAWQEAQQEPAAAPAHQGQQQAEQAQRQEREEQEGQGHEASGTWPCINTRRTGSGRRGSVHHGATAAFWFGCDAPGCPSDGVIMHINDDPGHLHVRIRRAIAIGQAARAHSASLGQPPPLMTLGDTPYVGVHNDGHLSVLHAYDPALLEMLGVRHRLYEVLIVWGPGNTEVEAALRKVVHLFLFLFHVAKALLSNALYGAPFKHLPLPNVAADAE